MASREYLIRHSPCSRQTVVSLPRRRYEEEKLPELEKAIVVRERQKATQSQALVARHDPQLEAMRKRVAELEEQLRTRDDTNVSAAL